MEKEISLIDCSTVSEEFSSSALFRQLDLYKGPRDARTLVSEYIEMETTSREEEARKGGTLPLMQPSETIRPRILRSLSEYISLITRVADFICDKAKNQFDDKNLSVVQVRTRFDFATWLVKLLFIVDGDSEDVALLARLLRMAERVVLEEERFTAELDLLNQREEKIDYKTVLRDYPFIRENEEA